MSDAVAEQFDSVALDYDFMASLFHKPDFFLDNLSKNRQLALDIGCGSGHLVKALSSHYEHVIGIDISESLLAIANAKQFVANITYLCMNAEQITLDQKFDLIVSENTLHHIDDVGSLLEKLKSLLKPEGKLIIRDVISDTPTPARWVYLVGAVQELFPNIARLGISVAWRVFRFRVSHHWLNHLANDVYLSETSFRELYASHLPDAYFPDNRTVIWQKKTTGLNNMITNKTLPFDVEKIRADFPILQQEHHEGVPLVFLDNAASSQKPIQVIDAISNYYLNYHANVHRGIHKLSEAATEAYENSRKKVRDFINAPNHRQMIFTRGTTESINLVAYTWGRKFLNEGDVVLSTQMEHHSNIVPWQILAEEKGIVVKFIPIHADGTLDLEAYQQILDSNPVKLVTVVHSSNVLGTVNPVKEMAKIAHEHGALILVDGAQSVPHMPVDVQDLDCDFLAFSSHKMAGPTGIGILYGNRDVLDSMPPYQGGGDMISRVTLEGSTWNDLPYKFEAGTPSIAEAIGLGVAVDYLSAIGMDKIHQYEQMITAYALERLEEVSGLTLYGPEAEKKGAVASFTLENAHAHDVAQVLDSYGIAVRAGHHCAMPLHDILCVTATARASFYIYNTFEEVDKLAEALEKVKDTFIL